MKVDMHVHSKFSFDCFMEPSTILSVARKRGLTGVAIVDHNTVKGGLQALKSRPEGLLVIVGCEVLTNKGDVIGLFLQEDIKSRDFFEVADEIRAQGGMSILPHPCRYSTPDKETLKIVNAIEGFNARSSNPSNAEALQIATENRLPLTGGSDAHFYLSIGHGYVELDINAFDCNELREKIMRREVMPGGRAVSRFTRFIDLGCGYSTKAIRNIRAR